MTPEQTALACAACFAVGFIGGFAFAIWLAYAVDRDTRAMTEKMDDLSPNCKSNPEHKT